MQSSVLADSVGFQSLSPPNEIYNGPASRLPLKTMKAIQKAVAILKETNDKGLYVLDVDYLSPAYNRWRKYCQPDGIEPAVCERSDPRYLPAIVFDGGVPRDLMLLLHLEVISLLWLYAPLRQVNFQPGASVPALPAFPISTPPGGFTYNHATMGAHKVFERISNGSGCPVIGSLPRGCVVCRVNVQYSNCAFSLRIIKA